MILVEGCPLTRRLEAFRRKELEGDVRLAPALKDAKALKTPGSQSHGGRSSLFLKSEG